MVNWWTNPDGQRRLVLGVSSTAADGIDNYDCCVLDMTPELAAALVARIERVRTFHAADSDLADVLFWDASGEYYGRDYDSDDTDEDGNGPPTWPTGDSRTEMDRLEIAARAREGDDGEAGWSAWVKHSDPPIKLTTDHLNESELRRFLAGDDPWATAPSEHGA